MSSGMRANEPARVRKVRVFAPLDDRHVDARERELGGEHQARGAAAGDDYS
jgi:hypothetical protein